MFCALACAPLNEASAGTVFAPIIYSDVEGDAIGFLKAGFVCLPSGILHWRDLRLPRDGHLTEMALLAVSEMGEENRDQSYPVQFEGRVREITMTLCVPGLGIGEKKPKGKGKINILWTKKILHSDEVLDSREILSEFVVKGVDPRRDALPLEQALLGNFRQFLESAHAK